MRYQLTLPKGAITLRNHIYTGSQTDMIWSPVNPIKKGGWKDGDTLSVTCTFNLTPETDPLPNSTEYVGLSAGACNSNDTGKVNALIQAAKSLPLKSKGALLGGITKNKSPEPQDIFYAATFESATFQLEPASRGELKDYIYHWEMKYNGANTVTDGDHVEIVFGYGDPMESDGVS